VTITGLEQRNPLHDLVNQIPEREGLLFGILPALMAVPLVLQVWAPTSFTIGWTAIYLALSAFFVATANRKDPRIELSWTLWEGVMFTLVPISSVVWGSPEHFWMATSVGLGYIAFALAEVPFFRFNKGWVGPILVGLSITACGLLTVHWLVALAVVPLVIGIAAASNEVRMLRINLERHLTAAEEAVLHDPLTGLLNRRGLAQRASELEGELVTVALIDVDRFKLINDSYGHQVGDQVLTSVATQLAGRLGSDFTMARIGGDEFVAIAPGAPRIAQACAASLPVTATYHERSITIECGVSIGISRGTSIEGAERLLSEAGFAMQDSKRTDNRVTLFGDALELRLERRIEVASFANPDANSGRLVPVAQTIVSGDRIVGCELLVRWERSDGKLLAPAQFLPMARETGLMSLINDQMLESAVRFAARFNNRPAAPFVSVNISSPHLSPRFFDLVQRLLETHRVSPQRLMIEITETEQLEGFEQWIGAAERLRSLGVRLAMDDFGTGYSSLARLQDLPITHLKFDWSLLQLVDGPFGQVVAGVASYAKELNIALISEGIEQLDELETMRSMGVNTFQGFFFHRPEPLDAVEIRMIDDHAGTAADEPLASQ